jgi:hypothetical protein
MRIVDQIRNNQLAIISLLVALTALGYTTWRNELTEENRTIRQAGFEMLVHVADLRQITYLAHYDKNMVEGNPRKGWTKVLVIKDLAALMPANVMQSSASLFDAWDTNWSGLGEDGASVAAIDGAIDELRLAILAELKMLD